MVSLRSLLFIIAVLSCSAVDKDAVFKPGDGGYACFRSPSLTFVDNDNRLLAILEAYKYGCVSRQWCDIVQKVSTDGGASWSNVTLIYGTGGTGGNRSSPCFQNVSPTLDRRTGKLFLPFHAVWASDDSDNATNHEDKPTTLMVTSDDHGRTYSAAEDVSASFGGSAVPSMPGGIQLDSGRLVVPVYRHGPCPKAPKTQATYCAYLVLSDEGSTWRPGAGAVNGSECQAAALGGNSVLLNMRDASPGQDRQLAASDGRLRSSGLRTRRLARSDDGGETFTNIWLAHDLRDPCVEGSTISVPPPSGTGKNRTLYFSHPSPGTPLLAQQRVRANLTVFSSSDQGVSWRVVKTVDAGPSAYSALALGRDNRSLLVLFDKGIDTPDPCQGGDPCWQELSTVVVPSIGNGRRRREGV